MIFSLSISRILRPPPSCGPHVVPYLFAGLLASAGLHGQGALTPPPGAPAPTMKSLDQIEARMIVNATNTPGDATNTFIISAPGSYYLTGNSTGAAGKHGISILADNVTLDLNGFALIGGAAGGAAPRGVNTTTAVVNLCIRNGSVRGWAGGGVRAEFAVAFAEKLLLSDNVGGTGLAVGNGSLVKDCVASGNATGFYLPDRTQISNCISTLNTAFGFDCTSYVALFDCTASRNFGEAGIRALSNCSILRCSVTRNLGSPSVGGYGIQVENGCLIADCVVAGNGLFGGIFTKSRCTIRGCTVDSNQGIGVFASLDGNRITDNSSTSNTGSGFYVAGANNLVIRNTAGGNSNQNYSASSASTVGPIVNLTAGGTITSTSPWANFNY